MTVSIFFLAPLLALSGTASAWQDGDSDIGRLPAMGFNTWNAFNVDINQTKVLTAAQKMVEQGLKDVGYMYVNIDDAWSDKAGRDNETQRLVPDPDRFPDGISGVADQVHAMGLKLGIYSAAGTLTCAGYPASLGFETIDAQTWAEWGVDYLKYDNCNVPANWTDVYSFCVPDNDDFQDPRYPNGTCPNLPNPAPPGYDWGTSNTAQRFMRMRNALAAQDRPMLYSLCEWGNAYVQTWGNETGHSWRSTGDINPSWTRIKEIINENSFYMNNVNFFGHSDPDMLEVGNGDLTLEECRTHFALWAAMKSPLLIGTDLSTISDDMLDILRNKYLTAFNQDGTFGEAAAPYKWGRNPDWTWNSSWPAEFWSGKSTNGTMVLMMNTEDDQLVKTADWAEIPGLEAGAAYNVIDAWSGDSLGCLQDGFNATLAAHDTAVLLVQDECSQSSKRENSRA